MADIPLPLVIAGAVLAFLAVMFIRESRRRARFIEEFARAASMRGWQFEPVRHGYDVRGVTGSLAWTFKVRQRPRNRGGSMAHWHSDTVRTDSGAIEAWIQEKGVEAFAALKPGNPLLTLFLLPFAKMLGTTTEEARAIVDVEPVATSGALAEYRVIRAKVQHEARAFLDAGGERVLLAWDQSSAPKYKVTLALLWHRGIDFVIDSGVLDLDRLEPLVRFGSDLADALQRAKSEVAAQY